MHQLFNLGQKSAAITLRVRFAIAIAFLLTNALDGLATEYVFTAPPEVDLKIEEIPKNESEYPLYECSSESETEGNDVLDSHDCTCTDCEELPESNIQSLPESSSKIEPDPK